jgi:hypothetical protein
MSAKLEEWQWRQISWRKYDAFREAELERVSFLMKPISREINPEHITAPTKIRRVGGGFSANGKDVKMGEVVTVPRNIAVDLCALGRAEYYVKR